MMKHLSTTRHKSVIHCPSQEQLECEDCQDSNIHQLIVIRYGGYDMSLLCQTCFGKQQDKPSTQYTLQNGSILKNIPNYLTVRDLNCSFCHNDNHLSVDKQDTSLIACYKCIKEKNLYATREFVKESDGTFLYVLLGIKEHVKTSSKPMKRGRKVGRGKSGKGSKFSKPNRPINPKKTVTPSHNNETLRSFKALDRKEVSKIRPEDEKGQAALQKPTPAPFQKTHAGNSRPKPSKPQSSKSSSKGPKSFGPKPTSLRSSPASREGDYIKKPVSKTSNSNSSSCKASPSPGPKSTKRPQEKKATLPANELAAKLQDMKISSDKKDSKQPQKPKKGAKSEKMSEDKGNISIVKAPKATDKTAQGPKDKKSKTAEPKPANPKNLKDDKVNKKATSSKPQEKQNSKHANGPKKETVPEPVPPKKETFLKSVPEAEEHEEFEHIPKYLSNQPKLSYSSINEYFKEMCFHLYLEERLETDPITNFTTEWHKDNKQLFKVTIPITEEIERLVPEKLRKLGRLPFSINQSIFVARSSDKDNIWDCFVKDLNVIKRGSRKIELLLELYKWNDLENFPIGSSTLSILPCSATINRILFAMSRIENPKFIKMLLGKEPIRQINFNNRLTFTKPTFNDSQKNAIQHVLNNSITVLQGPPGTGKTSTIYEIILQLLRNLKTFPILVVAASNIAIDNIAEKLKTDKDLNILRIVSTEKEREYNEKHHLSDICLHHQVFNKLPAKNQEIALDLKYNRKPVSQNQYKKLLTVSNSIIDKAVAQAQVIFTTSVVAGGYQLKSIKKLPVVIMDESTQSSEASTLIPLSMPGVDRFIFVGDDKQLSSFSDIPYLEQSLFERVLKNGTYTNPHMLNTQYRMHPKISEFPIKNFYHNLVQDGLKAEDRQMEGVEPIVFVNYGTKHQENKVSNFRRGGSGGYTYTNQGEAQLILRILKELIVAKDIPRKEISVITPYSAQRDLVADMVQKDAIINPSNQPIEEEVDEDSLTKKKPTTIKTIVDIMISSIDAFQGREKDIIIFSCVRSNEENKIGFVKDARRLNVALTRARYGLLLIGNAECMSKGDELWERLIGHLRETKAIRSEEELFK